MKLFGEAAAKAARHRKFSWCRRDNGFSDMPLWRSIARRLDLPLPFVQAFAGRLEEMANAGDPRGYIGDFDAEQAAAAHDIDAATANRIFAELETRRWIVEGHIESFFRRNPDVYEDRDRVNERKKRERERKAITGELAKLTRLGLVTEPDRLKVELAIQHRGISLDELSGISGVLRRTALAQLSTGPVSHRDKLSTDQQLSTGQMSHRDNVTVTTRADQKVSPAPVDNSGDNAGGESAGLPKQQETPDEQSSTEAARWLEAEGARLIVELSNEPLTRAAMLIERWGRDLEDPPLMVRIIAGAVEVGLTGARLQLVIGEQVRRHLEHKRHGTPLPLMPPRPKQQRQEQPAAGAIHGDQLKLRRASGE
jgi:hypothetical protein